MRRSLLVAMLAAAPVWSAREARFQAVARVIDSSTVSTQVGDGTIRLRTRSRAASLVQVGSAAPVRVTPETTIAAPRGGDLVITLLY